MSDYTSSTKRVHIGNTSRIKLQSLKKLKNRSVQDLHQGISMNTTKEGFDN